MQTILLNITHTSMPRRSSKESDSKAGIFNVGDSFTTDDSAAADEGSWEQQMDKGNMTQDIKSGGYSRDNAGGTEDDDVSRDFDDDMGHVSHREPRTYQHHSSLFDSLPHLSWGRKGGSDATTKPLDDQISDKKSTNTGDDGSGGGVSGAAGGGNVSAGGSTGSAGGIAGLGLQSRRGRDARKSSIVDDDDEDHIDDFVNLLG